MLKSFIVEVGELSDPRYERFVTYPLVEIVLGALVGTLCGAEDWEDVVFLCEEKLPFLREYLAYEQGIATAKTFWRVFEMIDTDAFSACLTSWVNRLVGQVSGVVAIDGKTIRGARKFDGIDRALHVLSAYAHEAGMVLAQARVDEKSNEISAIPFLLQTLSIEGCVVTIDAMGTQTAIAEAIIAKSADYVLALKGNQGTLKDDVAIFFADEFLTKTCDEHTTTELGHGRIEVRTVRVSTDIAWLKARHEDWKNLSSIVAITSERTDKKTGHKSTETRFYVSSLMAPAARLLEITRAHWSIENNLHWMLDVIFGEDDCKTRKKHAAFNLTTLRKWALAMLKKHPEKLAIKRKIKKASFNNDFLKSILY